MKPFYIHASCTLTLIILIFFSCQNRSTRITKIEVSKIQSLNADSVTAVYMDSALNFKYHGPVSKSTPSNFRGEIPQSLWDSITQKFEDLKYQTLDTADKNTGQLDGYYYSLTICWRGGKRRIWRGAEDEEGQLNSLLAKILNSYKNVDLNSSTPFKFDNIKTGPLPLPSPPRASDTSVIRFPKPAKSHAD